MRSEPAASVFGNEQVVFEPYASEIEVFFHFRIVYHTLVRTFSLPFGYQCRDEINTRFIGDNVPRPEPAGHPEGAESELWRALLVIVVAYEVFSEVFHVVNVNTHIVSESVRHEESGNTFAYHVVDMSVHKSERFQSVEHLGCHRQVDFPVRYSRCSQLECQFIAFLHYVVYAALLLCEYSAARNRSGEV